LKIYHYCHYIEDTNTQDAYQFDLKPFLKAFTNWDTSIQIASSVVMTGDKIFLVPVEGFQTFIYLSLLKQMMLCKKLKEQLIISMHLTFLKS
jgi:hypothetical protein